MSLSLFNAGQYHPAGCCDLLFVNLDGGVQVGEIILHNQIEHAVDSAADTELALALDAGDDLTAITPENTDVVVEFTVPSVSLGNVLALVKQGVDVVVGTTGWTEEKLDQVRAALAA